MCLINTRPASRAHALSQSLAQRGVQVLNLPLLELKPFAFDAALAKLYAQLPTASAIVVVSPTAVEMGMRYLQQAGLSLAQLSHVQWIAVGQKTAQALADFAIQAQVPLVESSEGMLQLQALQDAQLGCVAVWRGEGGRQFMLQQLQQRGVRLLNFHLYQRHCPVAALQQWQQMQAQLPPDQAYAVLISSEASWHNWLSLDANIYRVVKPLYLVLGERVAQLMQKYANLHQQQIQLKVLQCLQADEIYAHMLDEASL